MTLTDTLVRFVAMIYLRAHKRHGEVANEELVDDVRFFFKEAQKR